MKINKPKKKKWKKKIFNINVIIVSQATSHNALSLLLPIKIDKKRIFVWIPVHNNMDTVDLNII